MATTVGSINFYENWHERLVEDANMQSDSFILLLTAGGTAPDPTHTLLTDVVGEVVGSGYARQTLTSTASSEASGVYTFDADDVEFTASGGSITAKWWVLFDDTLVNDPLVAWGTLDYNGGTPLDVVTPDTNTLTIEWNASGIFTVS